jgi:hypothetical protein
MTMRLIRLAALTAIQFGIASPVLAEATNAVIPYKAMDQFWRMAAGVDATKLDFRLFVFSKSNNVPAPAITLMIHSPAKGLIPVPLGTNGQVLHFPDQKELRRENPSIVSNQPKGSLNLVVSLQFPLPDALAFRYARLGEGVAEVNRLIKSQAGLPSLLAPKAQGVIFIFRKADAGKAKVAVAASAGQQEFTADKHGQVKLKLEKSLLSENPQVELSEKPQAMVPDIE